MNSEKLARKVALLSLEKKAENVIMMDMRELTNIADFFVMCSGDSDIQIKAISDHIFDELKKQNIKIWHIEGTSSSNWVLVDMVDVVLHIFKPETREFYGLEKLWGDAKIEKMEDK